MFVCISPNPAIDKRLRLPRLVPGGVNRATEVRPAPGGKATHVAMVLRALGADPLWIGFIGGASGQELLKGLREIGIRIKAVTVQQATRVNLEIIDDSAIVTEILEPGATPAEAEIASFLTACEETFAQVKGQAIIIASGSLPPGVSQDFYVTLLVRARRHGCRFFLDTSGEPLRSAIAACPDFVKPNREEAEWLTGGVITDLPSAVAAIRRLLSAGAKSAAISLGERGLVWCPGEGQTVYFAPPVTLQVRSTVGSGDATVAAFAHAAAAGLSPEETLRLAAACGAANCLADSPGAARAGDIHRLQKEIHVEILS
jgi:1-phosphofructokinase family hexose kinase